MNLDVFDRRPNERTRNHIRRLIEDEFFQGAGDREVSLFVGCDPELVGKVRERHERRKQRELVFEHAYQVARQVGWKLDPIHLIHFALIRLFERHKLRAAGRAQNGRGPSGFRTPDAASRKAGGRHATERGGPDR